MLIPTKFEGYGERGRLTDARRVFFGDPVTAAEAAATLSEVGAAEGASATAETWAAQQAALEERLAAQQAAEAAYGANASAGIGSGLADAGTTAAMQGGFGTGTSTAPGMLDGLGAWAKENPKSAMLLGFQGLNMLDKRLNRNSVPGTEPYNGPLSRFKYDPSTYQPYQYKPYADGGLAQGGLNFAGANSFAAGGGPGGISMQALQQQQSPTQQMAGGGIANLGSYSDGGRLLRGPGDGVSDSIPATIGGHQPARLADGEFVVPARIVSELGNGSTEAGARKLYAMMDRVQKSRAKTTGKGAVAKNTNASKHLPV